MSRYILTKNHIPVFHSTSHGPRFLSRIHTGHIPKMELFVLMRGTFYSLEVDQNIVIVQPTIDPKSNWFFHWQHFFTFNSDERVLNLNNLDLQKNSIITIYMYS
jgi:hypothetical protein